jgi:hypothetical protein
MLRLPGLYRLYKTVHMLDYWLKYTESTQSGQATLTGRNVALLSLHLCQEIFVLRQIIILPHFHNAFALLK